MPLPDHPLISIIIPVLNDADCLDRTLQGLRHQRWIEDRCEIIVCDGGSEDGSQEIARLYRCRLVCGEAGRARQMNLASRIAKGELLLFLHADSVLPADFGQSIATAKDWGFFRLRLNADAFAYRVIETAVNLRTRFTRVAGGDQGLFFRRRFFEMLGGYPAIPLMEDIALSKKARRWAKPLIVESAVTSSGRRWQQQGIVKTVLLMWCLRLAYWLGADPARLHRIYYPQRG